MPDGVEYRTLGENAIIERGSGLQKADFVDEGLPCIHYCQVYTHYGLFATSTKSYISAELFNSLRKISYGDTVTAVTSENVEDV